MFRECPDCGDHIKGVHKCWESGLVYNAAPPKKDTVKKDERLKEKLTDLREQIDRLVKNQNYAIDKFSADDRYSNAIQSAKIFASKVSAKLKTRVTKETILSLIDENKDISRMFNNVTKGV